MKLLSIVIPSYNSQDYLNHCVDSLLLGGDIIEAIIVNDGSTDGTQQLAEKLAAEHPDIIKVINKENGGHGSAVMAGIRAATGKYFKVVDSDDWLDQEAFPKVLELLKHFETENTFPDMILSNFIYDKQGAHHKLVMNYRLIIPRNRIFEWDECGHFPVGKYILMHAIIYRTEVLRECKLELPEHTFYVDNIFAFNPFPYVHKLYYLDVDLYHYFIGRDDQSVNEHVMIQRIDQQLRVNYLMAKEFKKDEHILENKTRLKKYMFDYLEIITSISSIMLYLSGTPENLEKKKKLWRDLKEIDAATYKKLRSRTLGFVLNLPGAFGRYLCIGIYHISQKFFGFN